VNYVTTSAAANYANKNVGPGKTVSLSGVSLSGTDAANYIIGAAATDTADITVKSLSISGFAVASGKTYDATTTATISNTGFLSGLVSGDTVNYVTTSAAANYANKNVGTGKTVTLSGVSLGGADSANYVLTGPSTTTADILAKQLTLVGVTGAHKVYDGSTAGSLASAGTLNGVVGSESVNAGHASVTFANANVGAAKSLTVSGVSISGADAGNYTIAPTLSTSADITTKLLGVAATKTYDGTSNLVNSITLTGLVGSETLLVSAAQASDAHVVTPGKYVSTLTLADGSHGGVLSNYQLPTLNASSAPVTITPAPLTLTATNTGVTKVYDGGTTAPAGFTASWNVSGLVAGDTAAQVVVGAQA